MIEFSERESKIFNLRFGRATVKTDFDQWAGIKKEIEDLKLDYLRLKVANPDSNFFSKLPQLSTELYMTGIIRQYKININESAAGYVSPYVSFRKVSLTDSAFFKELVKNTYTGYPMGHYHYPGMDRHFPMNLQLENIGSYFADHFAGQEEGKEAYIGYLDGEAAECFVSDFSDPLSVNTLYAGILPIHRDKDLFKDMIRYYKRLCFDRGKAEAVCGARIENLSSQYAMERESSFCYGHEWVYMISMNK